MNATENSPKPDLRLQRIKIVSWIFRGFLGLYVLGLVMTAGSIMRSGMPRNPEGIAPQSVSYFLHHLFIRPAPMPSDVVLIEVLRLSLFVVGMILLNRLFVLFGRGKFFAAENVRCVRWLGLALVLDSLAVFVGALLERHVFFSAWFLLGPFIILISWIADEGRKIQEEQELTI